MFFPSQRLSNGIEDRKTLHSIGNNAAPAIVILTGTQGWEKEKTLPGIQSGIKGYKKAASFSVAAF